MDLISQALGPQRQRLRSASFIAALVVIAILLFWLGQTVGAALLPLIGLLFAAIERRERWARLLAQSIATGRLAAKLEVQHGGWGELHRAVNGLLQERRVQQRLCPALPTPLPPRAVQALLGGNLVLSDKPRMAAVLLASHGGRSLTREDRGRKAMLVAWQALARAAQDEAERHGALLQPCGDAIMLSFGAFEERPAGESLRAALAVAESLQRNWRAGGVNAGGPLVLSLASGHALTVTLPGLGYCVLGAPVEQAVQLQHLARQARHYGLVCSEGAYYALRHSSGAGWQPTEIRIPAPNRPPQVVYGLIDKD